MGASLSVEAGVGEAQALDRATRDEVLVDDFRGVFRLDVAVPDGFGVDDDHGAVFALVEAAGLVDADFAFEPCGAAELLKLDEEVSGAVGGAGDAWGTGGAGILADKYVPFKLRQSVNPFHVKWYRVSRNEIQRSFAPPKKHGRQQKPTSSATMIGDLWKSTTS